MRGNDNVFALLFPMERVFEKYMEFVLNNSKDLGIKKVLVNGGKNEYLLSNNKNCHIARLQPDYLLKMVNGKDIVTDAKWKLLDVIEDEKNECATVNVSSGDVYQVFSYLHYYDAEDTAYLFVPNTETAEEIELEYNQNHEKEICTIPKKRIKIIPIDLNKLINTDNHQLKKSFYE
jgi:5-methylcytosine-specific restriction enzyme subunit McrC